MMLNPQGHPGHADVNVMKEKDSRKRAIGCHIQGPCVPWRCKLSLELFSVA